MNTKPCIGCNSTINTFVSKCPYCKASPLSPGDEYPSTPDLDFFSLSLYQSTIDEITNEYRTKYGHIDRILDTTYTVDSEFFFNRLLFFGEANILVYISPDKQVVIPYSQINGYNIIDNSFNTGGGMVSTTETDFTSLLGRTVAGAAIGGTTGAIIGGATASKTTHSENIDSTNHSKFSVIIKTNSISDPIIEVDFDAFFSNLQQFTAILDIIMRNAEKYSEDTELKIENMDKYLQKEIRKRHPEIVKEEIEREEKHQAQLNNSGCAALILFPIIFCSFLYFII